LRDETSGPENASAPRGEAIKALNRQLGDPSLKSSTRILILILLTMNRRMSANELRLMTECGKGSLANHLEKLESAGYVRVRTNKSFGGNGWRREVEVTDKGLQECKALLRKIRGLDV
jgi:DNA-binding MarR family transcriptional regulator